MSEGSRAMAVNIRQRSVPETNAPLHENALIHRVLAARGVLDSQELACSLSELPKPDALPDINKAIKRLLGAREADERIVIVGDYDCDGATSTAVALCGLKMLGFEHVDYMVPSRFEFGYGLSVPVVDLAQQKFQPQLLLTVDNGVASVEGVARANDLGVDVVITDHHLAPETLPDATALVNPNLPGCEFIGKNLAGVGVMFYVLLALRAHLKTLNDEYCGAALAELLDLVAIGTVADVVPLDSVNRILVEQGLRRIRAGCARPGILAIAHVAGLSVAELCTQDIGFGVGPRLNAAGRLDDMRVGVECLLSDSVAKALPLAQELNRLNTDRRKIESSMRVEAAQQLESRSASLASCADEFGVCLHCDNWHQGVIGILAGRIKETLYKPTVVFTTDSDGSLKGSARSVPAVHIRDVFQNIAARHPGMLTKFGGHAMAAGLSLPSEHLPQFRLTFNEMIKQAQNGMPYVREYVTDGALSESEQSLENAQLLARIMPWGQHFESPMFCQTFWLVSQKTVGTGHLKMTLSAAGPATDSAGGSAISIPAIAFNQAPVELTDKPLRIVYCLEANRFRDSVSLQLRVVHLESLALR